MAFDLALFDLVSPYVLLGDSFGQWHAALSVIFVDEHSIGLDDAGVVIRGVARFSGEVHPFIDPSTMSFGVNAENTEGHPANDPGRRDPWLDIRDAQIDFQLSAPRIASDKVAAAVTAIGADTAFSQAAAVLQAYDSIPADAPPSDYASTEFTLDLLLKTVVLRPPFLRPAKLEANGQMVEDTTKSEVKINLPQIKVRLSQGSKVSDPLLVDLLSAGASSLDDQGGLGVAQLVSMDPPYAFIGPSKCVGFGFRSATLDLADGSTPDEILSQFGFDESWTGIYFPEIRLFIAPHGADDFAVDAGARNLLLGIGASAGVTGDFDLEVVDQGTGKLSLSARFYDAANQSLAITRVTDISATVALPEHTRMVVDIDGGLTPYQTTVTIGGMAGTGRVFDIDLSAKTTVEIKIDVTDSRPTPSTATLVITANRRPLAAPALPGTEAAPATPPAEIQTTSITQAGSPVGAPRLRLVSETPATATVALEGGAAARWAVGGADRGTSVSVVVDLAPGASVALRAEVAGAAGVGSFTAYYQFDFPKPATDDEVRAFAQIVDSPGQTRSTNTVPAVDQQPTPEWPGGTDAGMGLTPQLASLPAHTAIKISGFASFETGGAQKLTYNTALAGRRAIGLEAIIKAHAGSKTFDIGTVAADMSHWNETDQGDSSVPGRHEFWKAIATWTPQLMPGTVTEGQVSRKTAAAPVVPIPLPDNPTAATPPARPSWFKSMGAKVRIVRNQFVALEIFGKFELETPVKQRLREGGIQETDLPALRRLGNNPADGLTDFRAIAQIDDATGTISLDILFGADPADRDGLLMCGSLAGEPLAPQTLGRDYLGLMIVFMPLLSAAANAVAADGALAEMAVTAGTAAVPLGLAHLNIFNVQRVIWYGAEVQTQSRPDGAQGCILLDLEVALSMDILSIVKIRPEAPLVVRYKAVGILLGNPPGQPKFQFRPIFDASKGYTIDISRPGAIQVAAPLGQILKILGARVARNNPLLFEIELGFAIDLGVVSIERARVRLPVDPLGTPELTAFAASIDIPGAIKGRGYLDLQHNEIKGQIDVTLLPLQLRIAAGVGVAHIDPDETGVIVTLDVEFPVAIPLANSGLGIYGFIGLFAMNYVRDESRGTPVAGMAPALAWLRATGGDPTRIDFWKPQLNSWAFGLGALVGTMGSSIIFNLKGIFLLELPGPRLLLMMKANLLIPMPERKGPAEGVFLAVIDLDNGGGTLTIGLAIDFTVDPLLQLTIPVEAFFDFNDTSNWHLFVGQYINPVRAKVLQIFDASGYLMLSGTGIGGIPGLPSLTGFTIAVGLHVSFTWGGGPLFAQIAGGLDAIVGFSPFRMAGILTVRGTLHLFILDISAWADLNIDVGERVNSDGSRDKLSKIHGDICGKVEFFFFSVEGCVSFELGDDPGSIPEPPPLAKSLKLISRSPALVLGTAVDKPVDGGMGDGKPGGDTDPGGLPIVPIDIIPTLLLEQPPLQDPALKFNGGDIGNTPEAAADGWMQRGDVWFKYTVKKVELLGPLTAGKTPAVWWKPKTGAKALDAQLALLSWVPDATPKALGSSKFLDEAVEEHWGTVCLKAAPAVPVFWSFLGELLGPSVIGWSLRGVAWPDPPDAIRYSPPDVTLRVSERWRSGNSSADKLRGIVPATVEGAAVFCPDELLRTRPLARTAALAASSPTVTRGLAEKNVIADLRGTLVREVLPAESLTLSEVLQRFASGQPVGRSVFAGLRLPGAPQTPRAPARGAGCFGRALASPVFDDGEIIAFGNPDRAGDVKKAWQRSKFRPGPLDDAIVVHTGEFAYARFYLYVPRRYLGEAVVVFAASNAADRLGPQHVVSAADALPPANFPTSWTDPSGPWRRDVILLAELATQYQEFVGVLVEVKGGRGFDRVQIGVLKSSLGLRRELTLRPFFLAGMEVLRQAEVAREEYDNTQQTIKQGVLTTALGLDSADNALLLANTSYQVRLTWDAERQKRPADGGAPTDVKTVTDQVSSFWFRTDANPPARLDPYILAGMPAEAEHHVFASDPVSVVFAVNNLNRLYGAYGKKLQARLKTASFRPITPPPGVAHPFPLNDATLLPVKAAVLSPWEDAVQRLVEGGCVPTQGDRIRHSIVTIPIPLDLYSDYVLDLEMLDQAAADGSPGVRVWRETFSTGGFHTLDEFARSFGIARVGHRGVHAEDTGKLQAMGVAFAGRDPQGSEFDAALQVAGLEALAVPKVPQAIIFWEPGAPDPQPVAILLDASEPMWRSRPLPKEITDGGLAAAKRWEMHAQPWLELKEQSGGSPIVDRIVAAPGGQRALVTLKPGARGQQIRLALRRIAQPAPFQNGVTTDQFSTLLDMQLLHAPWEEVD